MALSVTGDATSSEGGWAGTTDSFGGGTGNYWDTQTSGLATSAFGTGLTTAQFQDTETFIGIAEPDWNFATTWAPGDTGFYPVNYSTSAVILADPDDTSAQYGLTGAATTTGSVFGGPASFVFDEAGDTLDTSTLFDDLDISDETSVGDQSFTLATSSLDSANGVTYRVVDRTATIDITPAPLTITADDDSKTYGETFTPTDFTVSGTLFFSDSVDSVSLDTNGGDADAPVDPGEGSYSIFVDEGGATGTGLGNYDITFVSGTLTINPALLTITADDQTKTYGQTLAFDGTTDFSITSGALVNGDTVDEVFLDSAGAAATATVGSYAITFSDDASGDGLENYDITYVNGTLDVTQAPLTISANDQTKSYGDTLVFDETSDFSITAGTLFNNDAVDEVTLASAGADADADVGSYAIAISDPIGDGLDNYDITLDPGTLTVSQLALILTASDRAKTYGQTLVFDPASGFAITSGALRDGDTLDTATLTSTGAAGAAAAGTYSITFTGDVTGTGIENYTLGFVDGTLEVARAPLTITPTNQTKTFGTTFEFTGTEFTTSGFAVDGDGIDEMFLVSDGAPAEATPGSYPILISGFEGTGLDNYDITEGQGTMIVQTGGDTVPRPGGATDGLYNPVDDLDIGGDTSGFQPASGEFGQQQAAETFAKVQDIAGALEIAADACGQSSGDVSRYLACLSDALDDFASELDVISTDLPPGMENVAQIIQTARRQIDGAASRAAARLATATTEAERQAIRRDAANEARAALNTASNEIRKAITLVRAEDPELASLQRATITTVANAVDTVGIQLTRVTDL